MTCYIIESLNRNIRACHDSSTLQIHPEINIGLQYIRNTIEYIPKLQLHQKSLLTRKVFSRNNLSAQVFFLVSFGSSSSHIRLQFIFIFGFGSSWDIITRSRSSLDIIIGSGSSLDLDHRCRIIITRSRSSLDIDQYHEFYIMILLVTGISIEPSLFHVGCRPSHHVGLL